MHFFDFTEFITHSELLYFLAWRDVKVRYKQSLLGISWALIQPFLVMVVFSFIFGRMANVDSQGVPYPLFSLVAILPWNLFSKSLSQIGQSLVKNKALLMKVYIPRLIIPVSSILPNMVDYFIGSIILGCMMLYYRSHIHLSLNILLLPFFIFLAILAALAVGLWLAALNVKYRDIQQVSPFLISLWMWVSPVAYSSKEIPPGFFRVLYALNPMTGVISGFRWILLGDQKPDSLIFLSITFVIVILFTGLMYFRKTEAYFADIV